MDEKGLVELREKQTKLTRLITAIDTLEQSKEWETMKELLFNGLVEKLQRKIQTEGSSNEVSLPNLYKLQGELKWSKRYADLGEYKSTLKVELEGIKKRIQ